MNSTSATLTDLDRRILQGLLRRLVSQFVRDSDDSQIHHDQQALREYAEISTLAIAADDIADYLKYGLNCRPHN